MNSTKTKPATTRTRKSLSHLAMQPDELAEKKAKTAHKPRNAMPPPPDTESEVPMGTTLRDQVTHTQTEKGISLRALANALDVDPGQMSRWLKGGATKDSAETTERIETAAREWLASHVLRTEKGSSYIHTPTSEKIFGALQYAQSASDMCVIYGAPGVGKTRTIDEYRRQHEHVWVVTIAPSSAGTVPALEAVAEACGVDTASGSGARRLARAIVNRVAGLGGILIIDEAQHLRFEAIEELRSIHDRSECALALVGNETVYARLTGGARSAHFAQIFSRLGLRAHIAKPQADDIAMIAAHWNVRGEDELNLLSRIASRPGALRGMIKTLKLASAKGKPTHDRIRTACDILGAEVV